MNIDKTNMNVFKNPPNTLTSNTGIQDSICVRFVVAKVVNLPKLKLLKNPIGTLFIFSPNSILLFAAIKYPACV